MNKKAYRARYGALVTKTARDLRTFGTAALSSDAFELKDEPDNYRLVKNVLTAALLEMSRQWGPYRNDHASHKQIKRIGRNTILPLSQ